MQYNPSHISQFNSFVETHLNDAQRRAVTHPKGSLLVIAGAGSGKTRVITARITDLILNHGVEAHQIIALTFTNKAASEMKERIAHFLGTHKALPFVGTFHAYCLRLLKQHRDKLSVPFETILDSDDQLKIIKGIIKKHGLQKRIAEKNIIHQISQLKNRSIQPDGAIQRFDDPFLYDVYQAYEQEKYASKCLDFDDLLLHGLSLLKQDAFKAVHQQRVRHILIDEYQDTNIVQHELLKRMSLNGNDLAIDSLCAVGDEDQSIYSWRGATVTNIRNFFYDFRDTTIVKIEQNYRSIQEILDVANTVIKQNNTYTPKKLWSEKRGSNRIHVLNFVSEYQEAERIAHALTMIQSYSNKKLADVAILYRMHAQSRALEEEFIKNAIPYRIIGGVQFYDRMEIRDMLAYLKLIVNPHDRISCSRVINVPARGLGQKFEELFFETWQANPSMSYKEVAHTIMDQGLVVSAKKHGLFSFVEAFDGLTADSSPSKALEQIIEKTQYITHLKNAYEKEEAIERIANIDELISACHHFEQNNIHTIQQLLDDIALMQDTSARSADDQNAVVLMTLHAAKGLEFDTVIISGLEEGLLPTSRALYSQDAIEEERRLFYVGITRARERLLLSHVRYRHTYGNKTDQQRSQFLDDIPAYLVPYHDCAFWRNHDATTFFAQWLGITAMPDPSPMQAAVKIVRTHQTNNSIKNIEKAEAPKVSTSTDWKMHQPVRHAQYGIGVIQKIERRSEQVYIEVKFKTTVKKIASDFLSKV